MNDAPIKRTQRKWDLFFYEIAHTVALLSKDPDRKVGAVIITPDRRQMSFGYNGFPSSVEDLPEWLADRDFKLMHMVHAEDNALRQAPFPTTGCTLYTTSFPCLDCASKLKIAGIRKVIAPAPDFGHHRWGQQWKEVTQLFMLGTIEVVHL